MVPAYNAAETLGRTLDSILNQTDQRYRVIVVDDGSTDTTGEIAGNYVRERPDQITYVYQENRGLGGARNRGMELTETRYVSFLDSDDWLMPEYTETVRRQLAELPKGAELPEMILVLPQIYHEGSKSVQDWYDKGLFESVFAEDGVIVCPGEHPELYRMEVNQCRKLLSMEFVRRIGFRFEERIKWEDVYPHFYLLSKCRSCMGIGSVGFYYRIGNPDQITALRGKDRMDILPVFAQLLQYIQQDANKELEFPAMRVMIRFAIWCIRMSDEHTRKELVNRLHRFFRTVPRSCYRELRKGAKRALPKADARQYLLFASAIRGHMLYRIFNDYLYQDTGEKLVKKILGAPERAA